MAKMVERLLSFVLLLLFFKSTLAARSAACDDNQWPLCDYVYRDDGEFLYEVKETTKQEDIGVTTYAVRLTSQKWKDESWTTNPIWWHYLMVHVPDDIKYDKNAFLYVGTGSNRNDNPPGLNDNHTNNTAYYASATGMVAAVLKQVPNQPITFTEDPDQEGRFEDDTIAYTWNILLDDAKENENPDAEVVLRMPMCKAVVKAMDTIQLLLNDDLQLANIEEFMLAGESKRGWTTWMTSAIDDRVVAFAPVVLSCLNMLENFHHYWRSFGSWPFALGNYWSQGIMGRIDDPEAVDMANIVDPFSYRAGMTMPALMVSSASDEFFLLDDSYYFWDELPGEKHIWIMENSGHSISSSPLNADYWVMLQTFYISVIDDFARPDFEWDIETTEDRSGKGSISVTTRTQPTAVTAFSAMSVVDDRRDWRLRVRCDLEELDENCLVKPSNITWDETDVQDLGDGNFRVEYDAPANGYLAFFVKITFPGPNGRNFILSTEANILPSSFPYEDCVGEDCTGILV